MKRLVIAVLILLPLLAACFVGSSDKPLVVTSIPVWKSVAEYIGGRDFKYYSFLQGGESPHGYEPKPSQVRTLQKASLIVVHGLGLDDWILRGVSGKRILNIGELFKTKYPQVEEPGYHIWMNPVLMEDVYFEMAKALAEFYPKRETYYRKRAEDYAAMIEQLLGRMIGCVKGMGNVAVVIYHPVWKPLLKTLGIETIEIARTPEEKVTPERLRQVIEKARKKSAKLVLGETFADRRTPETVAREIGAKVLILNPLPDKDYVVALSGWGEKICNALSR